MLAEAINAYHALLQPELARESQARLNQLQRQERLMFGSRPLCNVLRPRLMDLDQWTLLRDTCTLVASSARQMVEFALRTPDVLALLALTPGEQALLELDPGYGELSVSSRLDSFLTTDSTSLQFVEYNAESPAAIAYEDVLSEVFTQLPIMQAFGERYTLTPLPARQQLLDALLAAFREWGGTGNPTIAIVDWHGLPTSSEFELFQAFFAAQGLEAVICAPEELRYVDGVLYALDKPVNLVYKRVLTAEFLQRLGDAALTHPLTRAYADGRVCVANNFRAKLLHKKMIFGLLSDPTLAAAAGIDGASAAQLTRHIPWTRRVAPSRTLYAGSEVDLIPFILAQRERLLLKPNDDYGGAGIIIGWETDPLEWAQAVRLAQASPFVVQERVTIAYEDFPIWTSDGLVISRLLVDTDPFLFGTTVAGCLTRLSTETLLNVTAGTGSTAPTFLVQPR